MNRCELCTHSKISIIRIVWSFRNMCMYQIGFCLWRLKEELYPFPHLFIFYFFFIPAYMMLGCSQLRYSSTQWIQRCPDEIHFHANTALVPRCHFFL